MRYLAVAARWGRCELPVLPMRSPGCCPLWRVVLVVLCWIGLAGSATPAFAEQTVLKLTLDLDQTSDWVRIELRGLRWRVLSRQLQVDGPADANLGLDGTVMVRKPPADTSRVKLRLELAAVTTGEALQVVMRHGDLGKVQLDLRAGAASVARIASSSGAGAANNLRLAAMDEGALQRAPVLPRRDWGRRMLAFYYGWWGMPTGPAKEWLHWDPQVPENAVAHPPLLAPYDSADPKVIAQHVTWAKQAGIDTLVLSWWHMYPHQQLVLTRLLDECQRQGITATVYIEVAASPEDLRKQLLDLLGGVAQHPAFLTVQGQKVVFLYIRVFEKVDDNGFRRALAGLPVLAIGDRLEPEWLGPLGGLHSYVSFLFAAKRMDQMREARSAARLWDKLTVATVMPAYDDTTIRFGGRHLDRDDGRYYAAQWAAAQPMDWVILTSFNELHEGSEIEPTRAEGTRWLELTRRYVDQWKAGRP